jgi:hypothetical protein
VGVVVDMGTMRFGERRVEPLRAALPRLSVYRVLELRSMMWRGGSRILLRGSTAEFEAWGLAFFVRSGSRILPGLSGKGARQRDFLSLVLVVHWGSGGG